MKTKSKKGSLLGGCRWAVAVAAVALASGLGSCSQEFDGDPTVRSSSEDYIRFEVSANDEWQAVPQSRAAEEANTGGRVVSTAEVVPMTCEEGDLEMYLHVEESPVFDVVKPAPGQADAAATRGTVYNGSNLTSIGVMAGLNIDSEYATAFDYMYNVEVRKADAWTANGYRWPSDISVNYVAYAPYCAEPTGYDSDDPSLPNPGIFLLPEKDKSADQATIGYRVPGNVEEHQDLLLPSTGVNTWNTAWAGATFGEMTFGDQPEIPLSHALTAVKFKAGPELRACTIKKIEFYQLYDYGTLNFADGGEWNWEADGLVFVSEGQVWDAVLNAIPAGKSWHVGMIYADLDKKLTAAPGSDFVAEGTEITDDAHTFLMIPQKLCWYDTTNTTFGKVLVVVELEINGEKKRLSCQLDGEWKPGRTVTYSLSTTSINWEYVLEASPPRLLRRMPGSQRLLERYPAADRYRLSSVARRFAQGAGGARGHAAGCGQR